MNIPGLKSLRLLTVQPITLLPMGGIDKEHDKKYYIEITFESDTVMNISIAKKQHDDYLRFMTAQGTGVMQCVMASDSVPSTSERVTGHLVPVAGPVDIEAELRKAVAVNTPGADPFKPSLTAAERARAALAGESYSAMGALKDGEGK